MRAAFKYLRTPLWKHKEFNVPQSCSGVRKGCIKSNQRRYKISFMTLISDIGTKDFIIRCDWGSGKGTLLVLVSLLQACIIL